MSVLKKNRYCRKCNAPIPPTLVIDGRRRVLSSRLYCLSCSPFGLHNTRPIIDTPKTKSADDTRILKNAAALKHLVRKAATAVNRHIDKKRKLIALLGGKCQKCGYCKDVPAVYHFHHINPDEKSFNISHHFSRKLESLLPEIKKCILLCANCHAELHAIEYESKRAATIAKLQSNSAADIVKQAQNRRKPRRVLECPVCSKSFFPRDRNHKLCSKSCSSRFTYERRCAEPLLFGGKHTQ